MPTPQLIPKYPSTPYWPYSPSIGRGDNQHPNPHRFVQERVVVTEKLDGGNTLLHGGEVYARSTSAPCKGKWMGMVRKHHAWKVREHDIFLYGEDIYGVHSIAYGPIPENETFRAFALRDVNGNFASFNELESFAKQREIAVVPVLFDGHFATLSELRGFVEHVHRESSVLGGAREGVVLRVAAAFPASEFQNNVCKSVRVGHVQTDEHWTRNWKPCELLQITGSSLPT